MSTITRKIFFDNEVKITESTVYKGCVFMNPVDFVSTGYHDLAFINCNLDYVTITGTYDKISFANTTIVRLASEEATTESIRIEDTRISYLTIHTTFAYDFFIARSSIQNFSIESTEYHVFSIEHSFFTKVVAQKLTTRDFRTDHITADDLSLHNFLNCSTCLKNNTIKRLGIQQSTVPLLIVNNTDVSESTDFTQTSIETFQTSRSTFMGVVWKNCMVNKLNMAHARFCAFENESNTPHVGTIQHNLLTKENINKRIFIIPYKTGDFDFQLGINHLPESMEFSYNAFKLKDKNFFSLYTDEYVNIVDYLSNMPYKAVCRIPEFAQYKPNPKNPYEVRTNCVEVLYIVYEKERDVFPSEK